MKRTLFPLLSIAFFLLQHKITAQNLSYSWANKLHGASADEGISIKSDAAGNHYVTGVFSGTMDFDPGPGTVNLTFLGSTDIFLAKYNPAGGLIWAKKIGGTNSDAPTALEVDSLGNIYLTGRFMGSVDFDPNAGTAFLQSTSFSTPDGFIAKYSAAGVYLWAQKIGSGAADEGIALALDSDENILVTGFFGAVLDFDAGAATVNMTPVGGRDVFVLKLSSTGTFIWVRTYGGTLHDAGNAVDVDENNRIYITGYFQNTADFDPGAGTFNLSAVDEEDVFLTCIDADGNFLWAQAMGGSQTQIATVMDVGPDGRVYIGGLLHGFGDFDPGPGQALLYGEGGDDVFLACYDTDAGDYQWVKLIASVLSDEISDIQVLATGNLYVTGALADTCSFEAGNPLARLGTVDDFEDIFLASYTTSGTFNWVTRIGGPDEQFSRSFDIREDGTLYITGTFRNTVDFDPGPDAALLSANSSFYDAFFARYSLCFPVDVISDPAHSVICETDSILLNAGASFPVSYVWQFSNDNGAGWTDIPDTSTAYTGVNTSSLGINGSSLAQNGWLFRAVIQNSCGMRDTSAAAMLTVQPRYLSTESARICAGETYVFPDGSAANADTVHTSILSAASGCDSIIITSLTISPLHFSELSIEMCSGETYTFPDGTTSDSSVYYVSTLLSQQGCDSLIATQLTVIDIDADVHLQGDTLTVSGNATSVQWVDCDHNFMPVPNATDAQFIPSVSGTYAALLTRNNCTETTDCFLVMVSRTREYKNFPDVTIYPNPVHEMLYVDMKNISGSVACTIRLTNLLGTALYEDTMDACGKKSILLKGYQPGLYIISLTENNRIFTKAIVKN